jgi:hypothetical protein
VFGSVLVLRWISKFGCCVWFGCCNVSFGGGHSQLKNRKECNTFCSLMSHAAACRTTIMPLVEFFYSLGSHQNEEPLSEIDVHGSLAPVLKSNHPATSLPTVYRQTSRVLVVNYMLHFAVCGRRVVARWQRVRTRWVVLTRTCTRTCKILPVGLPVPACG